MDARLLPSPGLLGSCCHGQLHASLPVNTSFLSLATSQTDECSIVKKLPNGGCNSGIIVFFVNFGPSNGHKVVVPQRVMLCFPQRIIIFDTFNALTGLCISFLIKR